MLATNIMTMIAIIANPKEKNSYMRSFVLFSLFFLSLFISTYSSQNFKDAFDLRLRDLLAFRSYGSLSSQNVNVCSSSILATTADRKQISEIGISKSSYSSLKLRAM